nr:YheC/YheD family protein [Paenibacillus phyllosphaerae]
MSIQRVRSKWAKTKALLKSESLASHVPETVFWSTETLKNMLNEHGMVYIKPDQGTFGTGVIRSSKLSDSEFSYQLGTKKHTFSTFEGMAVSLSHVIGKRKYLIQRGIHLLEYHKRRFDIRVMVQKNPKNQWETTGIIGRLSHPEKIVTNYHSGGTLMSVGTLMSPHTTGSQYAEFQLGLKLLGTEIAKQLQGSYPGLKEIGIDIAVDRRLKPWVLEVNTLPDPYIFRKIGDSAVFRKIHRYCVHYGRFTRKKKRS